MACILFVSANEEVACVISTGMLSGCDVRRVRRSFRSTLPSGLQGKPLCLTMHATYQSTGALISCMHPSIPLSLPH